MTTNFPELGSKAYYMELANQIELNREQLYELRSILRTEQFKILFYIIFIIIIITLATSIGYAVITGRLNYHLEQYSVLINIGAVFTTFGLFELLQFLTGSMRDGASLRRLIIRHLDALNEADRAISRSSRE